MTEQSLCGRVGQEVDHERPCGQCSSRIGPMLDAILSKLGFQMKTWVPTGCASTATRPTVEGVPAPKMLDAIQDVEDHLVACYTVRELENSKFNELESFKVKLGRFMEQYQDTPPVPGYTPANDNSLLSWGRTHTMPLS